MNKLLILFKTSFLFFYLIAVTECSLKGRECDGNGTWWFCPGTTYPQHYTRCCWDDPNVQCCPEITESTDNRSVMIVGITVITTCVILAIIVVICCFWSACPLSNMCTVNYTYDNIIAHTKEDITSNLPPENSDNCKNYSPVPVKIKPVEDV
ncbi:uncharacterized protein LOC142332269 [Lycorma delicatula]|uniref:uncharacterized protein LOC142332269 n=1 Tax=Lycorma delicatula TaxID=130591 RepID=UPI003F512F3C